MMAHRISSEYFEQFFEMVRETGSRAQGSQISNRPAHALGLMKALELPNSNFWPIRMVGLNCCAIDQPDQARKSARRRSQPILEIETEPACSELGFLLRMSRWMWLAASWPARSCIGFRVVRK